uniref:Major facilitator superfamily (MFS) profile domain-containing protein n=1 Tax=Clytia hemisphaerica TaxID=252671 RepID=A0A7M5XMQ9_9CNID
METSLEYLEWKKNRTRTTALACILILLYGIESQALEVTVLYYFSENFGLSLLQATFYYSVMETLFAVSNLISGILFGRYIDRTRNLRFVFLLNLGVICIGNLMYSIPWHIWSVMTGRFLCGINESLQTAVCDDKKTGPEKPIGND